MAHISTSDRVIARLATRVSELEEKVRCSSCLYEFEGYIMCHTCNNKFGPERLNEANEVNEANEANDEESNPGEVKYEIPCAEDEVESETEGEAEPAWMDDTTSLWRWPKIPVTIEEEAIGKAQDSYYASLISKSVDLPSEKASPKNRNKCRDSLIHPESCICYECRFT